ncbi:hypothetical protein ACFFGH_10745 [Lysobacter korlensis]|uniref:Uncharacterized protein n=1 Tax=Lysobacter korlensis TaxID=553636 RepID=A0ABV6RMV9_9GAMM
MSTEQTAHTDVIEPGSPEQAQVPAAKKSRRLSRTAIAFIVVSVLAVAGWTAFGIVLADNGNWNRAYQSVKASLADEQERASALEGDLDEMTASRDEYQNEVLNISGRESAVEKGEAELAAREAELDEREKAVDDKEAYIRETSLSDGTYTVGVSMEPGTYRTESGSSRCYWAIYRSGTNYDDI